MNKSIIRFWASAVSLGLVLQLTACGTLLHPERKGQTGGRVDPKIAILDAIGLLFFFIPGVIALAVSFSNSTIYFPSGSRASLSEQELRKISPNGPSIRPR